MNNPGSVIGTIADLSQILAKVDVDETEIVDVKVGQETVVKVDAIPGRQYHGKIIEVGSSGFSKPAQPDVTFFEVKILLDETSEDLRPGMSVRAEIETRPAASALVVPIQSVVERTPLSGAKSDAKADPVKVVFVVENGKGVQREVKTGISDETRVEILSGLKPDEKVITGPYRSLRDLKDGDAVYVTTPEKEDGKDSKKKEDKD
jgi:HlyD family secretion protein